ncbi:hypothetical protein L2E82_33508 [Cichorium intybus]|uniref:Uncharacterized protein n=1 Tax=Cichorium intybus TaxID=13427 RepID=A0ACB9BKQ2_CICIN|nr:hypothetical protein L2E82_33508 [Cichorium intybus]
MLKNLSHHYQCRRRQKEQWRQKLLHRLELPPQPLTLVATNGSIASHVSQFVVDEKRFNEKSQVVALLFSRSRYPNYANLTNQIPFCNEKLRH